MPNIISQTMWFKVFRENLYETWSVFQEHSTGAAVNESQTGIKAALTQLKQDLQPNMAFTLSQASDVFFLHWIMVSCTAQNAVQLHRDCALSENYAAVNILDKLDLQQESKEYDSVQSHYTNFPLHTLTLGKMFRIHVVSENSHKYS